MRRAPSADPAIRVTLQSQSGSAVRLPERFRAVVAPSALRRSEVSPTGLMIERAMIAELLRSLYTELSIYSNHSRSGCTGQFTAKAQRCSHQPVLRDRHCIHGRQPRNSQGLKQRTREPEQPLQCMRR